MNTTANRRVTLRLGTRSSLLALAQSRRIAERLEALEPGISVELVPIETTGDRDLQTPLSDVSDADFFSAQLDQALLAGDVDFCVHSLKDLDIERPPGIVTAALPERADPRDVVLFRADIRERLRNCDEILIGSCSVRREVNIGDFLESALPAPGRRAAVRFAPLRGAVDARVKKILPAAGESRLDGVVVALAALVRLHADPQGQAAIREALDNGRLMLLPLSACPAAAGQGVLAVECRAADTGTRELLARLDDATVRRQVDLEHAALERLGSDPVGVGATARPDPLLGMRLYVRGRHNGRTVGRIASTKDRPAPRSGKAWSAERWSSELQRVPLDTALPASGAVFVAHWRALDRPLNEAVRCWTSGVMSWQKLAALGQWVEGCTDNAGFAELRAVVDQPVFGLPPLPEWTALTHAAAAPSWQASGVGEVRATYVSEHDQRALDTVGPTLRDCTHFYWSSVQQFDALCDWLPDNAAHACGTGKTYTALRERGCRDVLPFASKEEWRQWLS